MPQENCKKNDLLATPADLKNLCINCGQPVPINTLGRKTCLNNRCARQIACKEGRIFPFSKEQRRKFVKVAHAKAKAMGVFDRSDWGSRNPETLKKNARWFGPVDEGEDKRRQVGARGFL